MRLIFTKPYSFMRMGSHRHHEAIGPLWSLAWDLWQSKLHRFMTISSQLDLTRRLGVSHASFQVKYANTSMSCKGSWRFHLLYVGHVYVYGEMHCINNQHHDDIKERMHGCPKCHTSQTMVVGGYVKVIFVYPSYKGQYHYLPYGYLDNST